MRLKQNLKVEIELTPEILAKAFWEMNAQDQALFFEELTTIATTWDFIIQMCNMNDYASDASKFLMKQIAEYGAE